MFDFKPSSDDPGDLVESSDDLGPNLVADEDSDESDDDGDSDDEDVTDVGEEAGKAEEIEENPFFAGSDDSDSDVSDVSDDDDEDDEDAAGGSKEPVDEEDELIKALKAAREKKVRNCPPDIKTQVCCSLGFLYVLILNPFRTTSAISASTLRRSWLPLGLLVETFLCSGNPMFKSSAFYAHVMTSDRDN